MRRRGLDVAKKEKKTSYIFKAGPEDLTADFSGNISSASPGRVMVWLWLWLCSFSVLKTTANRLYISVYTKKIWSKQNKSNRRNMKKHTTSGNTDLSGHNMKIRCESTREERAQVFSR